MTTLRLLPTEQRLIDALARRGLTLADKLGRPVLDELSRDLGWSPSTTRVQVSVTRRALGQLLPPPVRATRGPRPKRAPGSLTAREECVVDELEALDYAVNQRLPREVTQAVARRMGITEQAVQMLVSKVRSKWGVKVESRPPATPYVQTGLLPEAPVLPLGCRVVGQFDLKVGLGVFVQ